MLSTDLWTLSTDLCASWQGAPGSWLLLLSGLQGPKVGGRCRTFSPKTKCRASVVRWRAPACEVVATTAHHPHLVLEEQEPLRITVDAKERLRWSPALHQRFCQAVAELGGSALAKVGAAFVAARAGVAPASWLVLGTRAPTVPDAAPHFPQSAHSTPATPPSCHSTGCTSPPAPAVRSPRTLWPRCRWWASRWPTSRGGRC